MKRENGPAWYRAARVPLAALLLCCLLLLTLAGCEWAFLFEESEQEQVKDTAEEWADVKGLNPRNEMGGVNVDAVIKIAKRVFSGSTGDPEVDAALGSDSALADVAAADRLDEEGWKQEYGGISDEPFDAAIALRPEDWKYRFSRAAWNMVHFSSLASDEWVESVYGDFAVADEQADWSQAYVDEGIGRLEWAEKEIRRRRGGRSLVEWTDADSVRQCQMLYGRLKAFYEARAKQTRLQPDLEKARQYQALEQACGTR